MDNVVNPSKLRLMGEDSAQKPRLSSRERSALEIKVQKAVDDHPGFSSKAEQRQFETAMICEEIYGEKSHLYDPQGWVRFHSEDGMRIPLEQLKIWASRRNIDNISEEVFEEALKLANLGHEDRKQFCRELLSTLHPRQIRERTNLVKIAYEEMYDEKVLSHDYAAWVKFHTDNGFRIPPDQLEIWALGNIDKIHETAFEKALEITKFGGPEDKKQFCKKLLTKLSKEQILGRPNLLHQLHKDKIITDKEYLGFIPVELFAKCQKERQRSIEEYYFDLPEDYFTTQNIIIRNFVQAWENTIDVKTDDVQGAISHLEGLNKMLEEKKWQKVSEADDMAPFLQDFLGKVDAFLTETFARVNSRVEKARAPIAVEPGEAQCAEAAAPVPAPVPAPSAPSSSGMSSVIHKSSIYSAQ